MEDNNLIVVEEEFQLNIDLTILCWAEKINCQNNVFTTYAASWLKIKGKVVGGLSPALEYWRKVATFAASNFPSPRADWLALHHVCSIPFTTLSFNLMAMQQSHV